MTAPDDRWWWCDRPAPRGPEDRMLSTRHVAELLDTAEETLRGWRHRDEGPQPLRVGTRWVRYWLSDVLRWLDQQTRDSAA